MTLQEKLRYLEENHPDVYEVICLTVLDLVDNPSSPNPEDLNIYNFWIDSSIQDEDEAQSLFHCID